MTQKPNKKDRGWYGIDLDGTLAYYEKGMYPEIGEPIEPMVRRVKSWLAKGYNVRIFTARADDEEQIKAIQEWCEEHIGEKLEVTNVKDHNMIQLWDDRAVEVITNQGVPAYPEWDDDGDGEDEEQYNEEEDEDWGDFDREMDDR